MFEMRGWGLEAARRRKMREKEGQGQHQVWDDCASDILLRVPPHYRLNKYTVLSSHICDKESAWLS